jgi:hypothetical protein
MTSKPLVVNVAMSRSADWDIQGFLWLTQAKSVEKLKKEEPLEWQ